MTLSSRILRHWYQPALTPLTAMLLPLSWIFGAAVRCRRYLYRAGWLKKTEFPVPIIVVGNLTVGGTGKTPVVIWLAEHLRARGFRPGIVARGVGGCRRSVLRVVPGMDPREVGDEALLLAKRTGCPVIIARKRVGAVQALLAETDCNIVLSDDGLQHYHMARAFEIILIDGERSLGNGALLPAGPLRESPARLLDAGAVFTKGKDFTLTGSTLVSVNDTLQKCTLTDFSGKTVHAIAGIGYPEGFFASLRAAGIQVIPHAFPDHYQLKKEDIFFADGLPVVMTEKDAVKCHSFAESMHWYLPVHVTPEKTMLDLMEKQAW